MAKFLPGQSGNPAGRPRKSNEAREFEQACRDMSAAALARLEALISSKDEAIALRACQIILERGFGKPRISIAPAMTMQESIDKFNEFFGE